MCITLHRQTSVESKHQQIDKNFASIQKHQTLIKQTMRYDGMNSCPRICLRNFLLYLNMSSMVTE